MRIHEIDTPALLVDLDAMESNLQRMAGFFRDQPTKLRPHFKNHKVPMLAWKQMEAGAIGMTCATLREAEILVDHGVRDILVANEFAGESKTNQFADLSRHADLMVAVDHERVISDIACVARKQGRPLSVVVDINVGLNRCGVQPGQPACRLAKSAVEQGLRFRGRSEAHTSELQSPCNLVCRLLLEKKTHGVNFPQIVQPDPKTFAIPRMVHYRFRLFFF